MSTEGQAIRSYDAQREAFREQFPLFADDADNIPWQYFSDTKSPFEVLGKILRITSRYRIDVFLSIPDGFFKRAVVTIHLSDECRYRIATSKLLTACTWIMDYIREAPDYLLRDLAYSWVLLHDIFIGTLQSQWFIDISPTMAIAIAKKSRFRKTDTLLLKMINTVNANVVLFDTIMETVGSLPGFWDRVSLKTVVSARRKLFNLIQQLHLSYLPDFNIPELVIEPMAIPGGGKAVLKQILTKERLIELHYQYDYCVPGIVYDYLKSVARVVKTMDVEENRKFNCLRIGGYIQLFEVWVNDRFVGMLDARRPQTSTVPMRLWTPDNREENNESLVSIAMWMHGRYCDLVEKIPVETRLERTTKIIEVANAVNDNYPMFHVETCIKTAILFGVTDLYIAAHKEKEEGRKITVTLCNSL